MSEIIPGVLSDEDLATMQDRFGVGEQQVRRDHIISHVLAALTTIDSDSLVFFGGTALARTHLVDLRLSEDIDLIVRGRRGPMAHLIEETLKRQMRRSIGALQFEPPLSETRDAVPSVIVAGRIRVQIQLLEAEGHPKWPTELRRLEQRYADSPEARMRVFTAPAFAAAKLAAWHNRAAPRDLYDLWALAKRGDINEEARELFAKHGPLTDASRVAFRDLPSDAEWHASLSHQGVVRVNPRDAAHVVKMAWSAESA